LTGAEVRLFGSDVEEGTSETARFGEDAEWLPMEESDADLPLFLLMFSSDGDWVGDGKPVIGDAGINVGTGIKMEDKRINFAQKGLIVVL
jgi:hypothetical protein